MKTVVSFLLFSLLFATACSKPTDNQSSSPQSPTPSIRTTPTVKKEGGLPQPNSTTPPSGSPSVVGTEPAGHAAPTPSAEANLSEPSLNDRLAEFVVPGFLPAALSTPSITFEVALERLLTEHPEIKKAKSRAAQYAYYSAAAKKKIFPSVEATVSLSHGNLDPQDLVQNYSVGFSTVVWDGTYGTNFKANVARQMAEEERLRTIEQALSFQLVQSYLGLIRAQAALQAQDQQYKVVEKIYQEVAAAYKLGLTSEQSMFEARAEWKKGEYLLKSAQGSARTSCIALLGLIVSNDGSLCGNPAMIQAPSLTLPATPEETIKVALETRSEVKIDLALITAAQQGVKLARADYLPKVSVGASYGYTNSGYGGGTSIAPSSSVDPSLKPNWSVGVSIRIPIFDFGKKKEALKAAQEAVKQAAADAEATQIEIGNEVLTRLVNLEVARSNVDVAIAGQIAAEESLKSSLFAFKIGTMTLTNLLIRTAEKAAADVRLQEAQNGLIEALFAVKVAVGTAVNE